MLGPQVLVSSDEPGVLEIEGLTASQVGQAAARNGFELHELTAHHASLEEAFMELTRDEIEYRTTTRTVSPLPHLDEHERIAA